MLLLRSKGYELGNIDCTVCAEEPKINPHILAMQTCLSEVMEIDQDLISIKATTSERMGFVGRKEGVAVYSTVLIYKVV
jgi:2-C-methyl-D-erythritol 2,4-cyclodiphosphate synthase